MNHTHDCGSGVSGRSEKEDLQHDSRLTRALNEYLEALEAGERPQRETILKRHAEIADELAVCLESIEFIHHVSPQLTVSAGQHGEQISLPTSTTTPVKNLGDYRILTELGRGGMGVVYEAEQVSLGRRVAVKILPFAALLNKTQLERFATEATAAARLQHDNIVTVYSVGCERGIHFIAMQLVDGPSLAEVIAELRQDSHSVESDELDDQPADTETVVDRAANVLTRDADGGHYRAVARIGREAAEALHYAHDNGVLHRDIKPSNLLLDKSGHVWIADFGLARVEDESQLTRTGDILGTLHYMSPEQATGQRDQIDARSDVYGLGATLYELAALRPVFDNADRGEVIKQVVAGNPVAPHRIDNRIPKPLSYVISKAMARRLDDRYQSAQEVANDLQRFLDGEAVKAKPPTAVRRARTWSRRHRLATAAIVGLLIVVLLLPFSTHHFFTRVPDDSQSKGPVMKTSKAAKVAATVAAMAIVTAGVHAKKPPKPPPDPGLTVHYKLWGADNDPIAETAGTSGVLVQQTDGKLLVAGGIRWPQSTGIAQLTRWDIDVVTETAAVDPTFGNDQGRFIYDFGDDIGLDRAWDVEVQPNDDKIVVVGSWGEWKFPFIARLNTDGSLDNNFGNPETPGIVDDPILDSPQSQFSSVTILDDEVGSIVTAGTYLDANTGTVCPLLVKFEPDGTRDPSFGQNGISFVNLGEDSLIMWGSSLAELEDGRLIAAGTGPDFATSTIFMFNPDGSLDPSFGNGGLAEVDIDPEGAEFFKTFVVQPDGKIVAVGGVSSNPDHGFVSHNLDSTAQFSIARFKPDGTLDKRKFAKPRGAMKLSFAPGGKGEFNSVQLLSDGRLLAGGRGDPGIDGARDIYLARFLSNGKLDESFDQDGWINFDLMGGDEGGIDLLVLTDSSYLVSGSGQDPVDGYTQFMGHVWEQ